MELEERKTSHLLFTIWDSKAQAYAQPFCQTTNGLALRFLESLVNDPQTSLHKYPEDYTLFRIGRWDERNGSIEMDKAPVAIAKAQEYKKEAVQ